MIQHYVELIKNSLIYGVPRWFSAFIGIILIPILTRYLSPSEFGSVSLALVLIGIVSMLIIFGMDSAIGYYVNFSKDTQRRSYISTSLVFLLFSIFLYNVLLIVFSTYMSDFIFHTNSFLIYFVIFIIPAQVVFLFFQNLLLWTHRSKEYFIQSIGYSILFTMLIIIFVVIFHFGNQGVFIAYLVSYSVLSLFGFMYTKDLYRLEFHYEKCIALLQYGYPFLFVGLVSVLLSSNDKIFLSVLLNLGEVGIYTIGVGLSSALSLITSGFQTALGPFAFKIASDSNSKIVYSRIFLYYSYIISFFWLGLVLFSKEILMVLVPSQYQIAYIVVPFLAGGVIMTGFLNIFCLSAGITKNTHLIAISSLSGLCMNMILMVFLIPHFGILGAAGASFVSICTSSIVMNILGQKIFFIDYPYKKAGLVFLIACIFWNLSLLTNTFSLLSSILLKIVLIFLFGILIFQLLKFDKHFFI